MTELCVKNLSAVLQEAGSSIEKVVKVNVFLTTMDNFAEMNGVYEKLFKHKPARSEYLYLFRAGRKYLYECSMMSSGDMGPYNDRVKKGVC